MAKSRYRMTARTPALIRGSLLFTCGTLISRVFGLVRESVIAATFGAGWLLDAFLVANRLPNMLRELLAEGALGSSFTKVFTELMEENQARAKRLLIDALWLFLLLTLAFTLVGLVGAPFFVQALTMARSTDGATDLMVEQATHLTRILFPFIGLMAIGSVLAGALHQQGRFLVAAASPIALNVGYIVGALVIGPFLLAHSSRFLPGYSHNLAILGLAVGVLLGGLMQTLIQLFGVWRPVLKSGSLWPQKIWNHDLVRVIALMAPMVLASGAGQINVLVNTNFATSLEDGAVSWLSFAFRVLQLPIGLFGVAVASVSLPSLVRTIKRVGSVADSSVSEQVGRSVRFMLCLIIPSWCFLAVNPDSVIALLFQYGRFSSTDVEQTGAALLAYSFGLVGYGLVKVLTSVYYAMERTRYAMIVSLISIVFNLVGNLLLVDAFGHLGLAYTASAVLTLNALLLSIGLVRARIPFAWRSVIRHAGGFVLLAGGCVAIQLLAMRALSFEQVTPSKWNLAFQLMSLGILVVALAVLYMRMTGLFRRGVPN